MKTRYEAAKDLDGSMELDSEDNGLLDADTKAYKSRWWILLVSFLHLMHQNIGLNTWGPIAQSAKAVYDWGDKTIAFILNMGRLGSLVFVFFGCYILHTRGLRWSMLTYASLMMISNTLRCLTRDKQAALWLMAIAEALNGSNGVISFAAAPIIASTWFLQRERITATALISISNYIGEGVSSILGPVIVQEPIYSRDTGSNTSNPLNYSVQASINGHRQVINVKEMEDEIMLYLYSQCGVSGILLLATLIYFPAKPPSAPSNTANMQRMLLKKAIGELLRRKWLCVLLVVFGLMVGVYVAWTCVLNIVFNPLGLSQINAGWLGLNTVIAGALLSFIIARISDIYVKKLKPMLLSVFALIIILQTWTALLASRILPFNMVQLHVSCIIGGALISSSFPLLYELMCEMSFPLPESIINGVVDALFLVFANGFYVMMYFPVKDYTWMPWILVGGAVITFLMLIVFPITYTRTDIDLEKKKESSNDTNQFNMEVIEQWQK